MTCKKYHGFFLINCFTAVLHFDILKSIVIKMFVKENTVHVNQVMVYVQAK